MAAKSQTKQVVTSMPLKKKKPAVRACGLSVQKFRGILTKVEGISNLPAVAQDAVAQLRRELKCKRISGLTCRFGQVLKIVETALQTKLREAQATVSRSDMEREARVEAQSAAECRIAEVKREIAEQKTSIKSFEKAIDSKRMEVGSAKEAQKSAESDFKTLETRKRQLESAEHDAYGPLKEVAAIGSDGNKRLSTLRRIGKAYNFHEELISVIPAILKKDLDKRRTFDNVVMQQLDVEFAKQQFSLLTNVKDGADIIAERAFAVEEAKQAVRDAQEERKRNATKLASLEAVLQESKEALVAARGRVRAFPADTKRATQELARAKACISKFHKGPLTLFSCSLPRIGTAEIASERVANESTQSLESDV